MVAAQRRRRIWFLPAVALLSLGVWVGLAAVRGLVQSRLPAAIQRATSCSFRTDSLEVHYLPPGITLTGLQLDCGHAGSGQAALVQATVELLPLWRRSLTLSDLVVVSPQLNFRGLPSPQEQEEGGLSGKGQMTIRSFRLRDGRLRYQDVESGFLLEATGIQADSTLLVTNGVLEATVTSTEVRITLDDTELPPATLEGTVRHQGKELDVLSALLRFRELGQASAHGRLRFGRQQGASPSYDLQLEVRAASAALAQLLSLPEAARPDGEVEWSGQVTGAGTEWQLDGQAHSLNMEMYGLPITDVALHSTASAAGIHLDSLRGGLLQGVLGGSADFHRKDNAWRLTTHSRLEQASLDDLLQRLAPGIMPPLGSLLSLEVDGGFPLGEPRQADATLAGSLVLPAGVASNALRLQGSMQAVLQGQQLRDLHGYVDMPGVQLQLAGNAHLDGGLELGIGLQVTSLEQLARTLSPHFAASRWLVEQRAGGSVRWSGRVDGNMRLPEISGVLSSRALKLAGLSLGHLGGSLRLREGRLYLDDLRLDGDLASVRIRGDGALADDPDWQLEWSATRLDLAKLAEALDWPVELHGRVAAQGQAWFRPDDSGLRATLQSPEIVVAEVLSLQQLEAQISLDRSGLQVQQFVAHAQEGTVRAAGSLQGDSGEGLQVQFVDVPVKLIPGLDPLRGRLSLTTTLLGTLDAPRPAAAVTFRLEDLSWDGTELLDLHGRLEVTDEKMSLQMDSTDGLLSAHAVLLWDEARNSHGTLSLQPFQFPLASHPQAGDLVAHVGATRLDFSVPLRDLPRLAATMETQGVALVNAGRRLEHTGAVQWYARGDRLELPATTLRLGDLEFTLAGKGQLGSPPSYSLELRGVSDLSLMQPFVRNARLAGTATLDLQLEGQGADYRISGQLDVEQGYLKLPDFRHALEDVHASLQIDGELILIRSLTGRLAGGQLEASGELRTDGKQFLNYRIETRGRRIALRYPDDFPSLSDFELLLEGDPEGALLQGDVRLLRGRFTRKLNLERSMLSRVRSLEMPPIPGPPDVLELDLTVTAEDRLWLDNDLGRAEFRADLVVQGTAARPVLDGTLDLIQAGSLRFQRVNYTLSGATLVFSPVFPNDPEIDAEARAERLDPYTVRVHIGGRLSNLRFDLSAEPELGEDEIAAMLLSGGVLRQGSDPFHAAASSTRSLSGAPGTLTDVGADYDPLGVQTRSGTTRQLTLGAQLSSRLTSSWSTGISGTGESTVELRYRLLPHLELREAKDLRGANLAELRYVRSFRIGRQADRRESDGPPGSRTMLRVHSLTLEGVPRPPGEKSVREAMNIRPGSLVERNDLLVMAARARGRLTRRGYPLARVKCDQQPEPDDRLSIRCQVEPGVRVHLRISDDVTGRRKKKKKQEAGEFRKHVLESWREVSHVEDLTSQAVRSAESFHRKLGRARVSASADLLEAGEGLTVVLQVNPGPVVRVTSVRLEGVESLLDSDVRSHLEADHRVGIRHPRLTDRLLDADRDVLRRLYYAAGFLGVQIPPARQEYPAEPHQATVIYEVEEGLRSLLEGVSFEGNHVLKDAELRKWWSLPEDGYPDPVLLEHCAAAIQQRYHHLGYADANVVWTLQQTDSGARAVFRIREGTQFHVGRIRVEGQQRVREAVIRREVNIQPGALLRRDELTEVRQRVRALGMFQSVVVRGEPVPGDDAVRDVVVRVRERDDLDLGIGVGVDDEEGARFSFSLGHQPFRGLPISTSLQLRVGGDLLVGQLLTHWRRLRGSRHDFLSSLGVSELQRDGFTEQIRFLSLQVSRRLSRRSTLLARYRLEDVRLTEIDLSSDGVAGEEVFLASLGAAVIRNALDDPFLPRRGGIGAVDLSVFTSAVGSEEDFVRVFMGRNHFWPFQGGNIVFSTSARVGLSRGFGGTEAIPTSERFFAGGVKNVRGFRQDFLGPLDENSGDPVGGAALIVLNQEVRFRLMDRLNFHLFLDAGNVYPEIGDMALEGLRFTAGPGFSYLTPAGPIRIYYGFKLDREDGEDGGRLHFTFGRAF